MKLRDLMEELKQEDQDSEVMIAIDDKEYLAAEGIGLTGRGKKEYVVLFAGEEVR
jgi:hypothetical protein